ncbi:MAG: CBS domain-containing protein [Candidatus Levybacteria bacterium]|nr:CBS domain-containing protein [Candidatus Levybacteria bacterium]
MLQIMGFMKVLDVMQKQVDFVTVETSVKDAARLIFGRGIYGVPVCKEKKIVGFITERDILRKFYPSMQEYVEDPVHARDFEAMEKNVSEIFNLPAKEIMNEKVITIEVDSPLMRAQSYMLVYRVGRLPVVDKKGNLVGIVTQGDIFRAVVGQQLPFEQDEQFHDWLSRHYDLIIDWEKRLAKEIPDLTQLFKREKVKTVLDVGCGTGRHAIALAKEGFHVVGIDRSSRMIYVANEALKGVSNQVKDRIRFIHLEYKNLNKVLGETFDVAMFMGTGFAHNKNYKEILTEISKVLNKKAILIFQITNFEKVLKINRRLFDFHIRQSLINKNQEHAFLRFYDPQKEGLLTLNVAVFDKGAKRWMARGTHAMSLVPLDKTKITSLVKRLGFSNVSSYGGEAGFYYDSLFKKPFKPMESDVLHIVAKR